MATRKGTAPAKPAATRSATRTAPPKKPVIKLIKVQAFRMGIHNHGRRRVGDVFTVREQEFNKSWMQRVDPEVPERITGPREALQQAHDETLGARVSGRPAPTGGTDPGADDDKV